MPNIFAVPVSISRIQSTTWGGSVTKTKRKKRKIIPEDVQSEEDTHNVLNDDKPPGKGNLEYTAVVTPAERHQRRVAGHPLDQVPPSFPFPHADDHSIRSTSVRQFLGKEEKASDTLRTSQPTQSLHLQHLAALTTIVHLSLLKNDLSRAARALGLLFREDAVSENAAGRSQGIMGIAAEVLLRNGNPKSLLSTTTAIQLPFTHDGFEKAKRLYERLIIRHPYHKSWPNVMNAIDFYLAMFNLWIYVVHTESIISSDRDGNGDFEAETSQKVRELEQAIQIAQRMDTCMATVPYMDEPEFIRLRAMVALWTADLHEDCALLANDYELPMSNGPIDMVEPTRLGQPSHEPGRSLEARLARDKARELLSRLDNHTTGDEE